MATFQYRSPVSFPIVMIISIISREPWGCVISAWPGCAERIIVRGFGLYPPQPWQKDLQGLPYTWTPPPPPPPPLNLPCPPRSALISPSPACFLRINKAEAKIIPASRIWRWSEAFQGGSYPDRRTAGVSAGTGHPHHPLSSWITKLRLSLCSK